MRKGFMSYKIAVLISLLVTVGVAGTGCSVSNSKSTTATGPTNAAPAKEGTGVGNPAPEFQLTTMDGSQVALSELRGKPTVLIFWTAWCPVCKEESPHFNALTEQYEPRGVHVLGINIQDSLARTQGGIKDFGIRYTVARDADAAVSRRYHVTGTPTIVFLDASGVVAYVGNELPTDYNARLDALLAKGA
jgi:peroxiredoxin